jgi:hypothetical protein
MGGPASPPKVTSIVTRTGGQQKVETVTNTTASHQRPTFTSEVVTDTSKLQRSLTAMRDWVEHVTAPASSSPLMNAALFRNIAMTSGVTAIIKHGLHRPYQGYFCTRSRGAAWSVIEPTPAVNIASSTNATPIVVTTATSHNLTTGDQVTIKGHTVNTAANGTFLIVVTGATTYKLVGSVGVGVGGATGKAILSGIDFSQVLYLRSAATGTFDVAVY